MVTSHLPEGHFARPANSGMASASALQSGERFGSCGRAAIDASRTDLTSQGKFISQRWKSRNAENTIRFRLAGSPMLFCESVITGSNKSLLQQLLEPGLVLLRLTRMACCEG